MFAAYSPVFYASLSLHFFFFLREWAGFAGKGSVCLSLSLCHLFIPLIYMDGMQIIICQPLGLMLGEKQKSVRHGPCPQRASSLGRVQDGWGCNRLHQPRRLLCHLGRKGFKGSRSFLPPLQSWRWWWWQRPRGHSRLGRFGGSSRRVGSQSDAFHSWRDLE